MCLPSSKGLRSTVEMSFVRSAKSSITFRPISECVICRPRKRMLVNQRPFERSFWIAASCAIAAAISAWAFA